MTRALLPLLCLFALAVAACGGSPPSISPSPVASTAAVRSLTPSPSPVPVTAPPTPAPTVEPTPEPGPPDEPDGFPLAPSTRLGVVTGAVGSRELVFGGGPTALGYARDDQPSGDPVIANRSGWDCRTHHEYEGIPAVDFYVPMDTPLRATMSGTATIYAISTTNDFDYYGVSREPYIGNPDRSRAPYSPFPGPSGGMGVYVHIENDRFVSEYGHLDLPATAHAIPAGDFLSGYSRGSDYATLFAFHGVRRNPVAVAQWQVQRGDVIGLSGDVGYSEGPHVHYTVRREDGPLLCPTTEAAFPDNGWLFK